MMDRITDIDGMDTAINILFPKNVVDRLQDPRSRAERIDEGDRIEFQAGGLEFRLQLASAHIEFMRGRALERKDRLLLVADGEDGAGNAVARALAGGEFGDDMGDDVPLPGARVLRLVDQDMVDAAVELVMHPAGRNGVQHV